MLGLRTHPLKRSIYTLYRQYSIAGVVIWNVGVVIALVLFSLGTMASSVGGALVGFVTCVYLGHICLRIGRHQDKLTNFVDPKKRERFSPFVFINIGATLLLFAVIFVGVGAWIVINAI